MSGLFDIFAKFLLDNMLGIIIGLAVGWCLPTPGWVMSLWKWFWTKLSGVASGSTTPPSSG